MNDKASCKRERSKVGLTIEKTIIKVENEAYLEYDAND